MWHGADQCAVRGAVAELRVDDCCRVRARARRDRCALLAHPQALQVLQEVRLLRTPLPGLLIPLTPVLLRSIYLRGLSLSCSRFVILLRFSTVASAPYSMTSHVV